MIDWKWENKFIGTPPLQIVSMQTSRPISQTLSNREDDRIGNFWISFNSILLIEDFIDARPDQKSSAYFTFLIINSVFYSAQNFQIEVPNLFYTKTLWIIKKINIYIFRSKLSPSMKHSCFGIKFLVHIYVKNRIETSLA